MCSLEQFKVDLRALDDGENALSYVLDDAFFAALSDADEVEGGSLHVSGSIRKAVGFYELQLSIGGTVRVACDRCLEDMLQPIDTELRALVKLGSGDSEQDDVIIVDEAEALLDLAWPIYETIALAVPIQHVHQPGGCNETMMQMLSEHLAARSSDADVEETVDPRWSKLKELKFNN